MLYAGTKKGLLTRNDFRAVNQLRPVMTKNGKLGHGRFELVHHLLLVIFTEKHKKSTFHPVRLSLLTDEALPDASSARIASKSVIGLETHLPRNSGFNLSLVSTSSLVNSEAIYANQSNR